MITIKRKLYVKWHDMINRCYNPKRKNYKYYGARGITVCKEWKNNFYNFYNWALQNGYDYKKSRSEQSLDRINNDGNYEPSNCRFTTMRIQNINMRHQNTSGYIGVSLHSSKCYYVASVKILGKKIVICNSKSKNECAKKRNEYIIKNNLPNKLNEIKEELDDIIPIIQKKQIEVFDKTNNKTEKYESIINASKKLNLTKQFISQCLRGKANSKKYNFKYVGVNNDNNSG